MSCVPHKPTEATRAEVRVLAGHVGMPQNDIAAYLGIDPKTLRKWYAEELRQATVQANAAVAKALFTKATKGNDTAAMIFWLKARANWREKQPEQAEGDDAPMPTRVTVQASDASVPRE